MTGFDLRDTSLNAPRAFEALAWEAVHEKDFKKAVNFSKDWLADEPFASKPALFGSHIASAAIGDYLSAAQIAKTALTANPNDPRWLQS